MVEVADIFREYGDQYRKTYKLPQRSLKAMSAIEQCRTATLGGHIDECDACGHLRISYNSCRNRHCPKCQGLAREKWLVARKQDLLPVEYFHVVFTIPSDLNPIALRNQREVYSILFKAASEVLLELGRDCKYLGAEIGFIAILHTWGQNLMDHPHLHCLVPGGGLSLDGKRWIPSRKGFFLPVKVMSRLFRGKFLHNLKKVNDQTVLKYECGIGCKPENQGFKELLDRLYSQEWIVYSKPSFSGPEKVLEYLGRYTHRVAISNNRIVEAQNGKVTFRWKDYADNNRTKLLTLDATEFIRRFLLHVLPNKFVKLRHYGLLSNRNRRTRLTRCQEHLKVISPGTEVLTSSVNSEELLVQLAGIDLARCPCCQRGKMFRKELLPKYHVPPDKKISA